MGGGGNKKKTALLILAQFGLDMMPKNNTLMRSMPRLHDGQQVDHVSATHMTPVIIIIIMHTKMYHYNLKYSNLLVKCQTLKCHYFKKSLILTPECHLIRCPEMMLEDSM